MWDPYAEFKTDTLENGLTVHAFTWANQPWEIIEFLVHSGAREDKEELGGVAHFVEHLINNNIPGMTHDDASSFFEDNAGKTMFGETGYLSTSYRFFVLIDNAILKRALEIFGNMLLREKLVKEIEQQRKVIMGEFNHSYPAPHFYQLTKSFKKILFGNHPLSSFVSPLGEPETINKISQVDSQEFYDRHYVPANIEVVAVGGLELHQLVELLKNSPWADYKPGQRNLAKPPQIFAPIPSETFKEIKMSEYSKVPPASATFNILAVVPGAINSAALNIFNQIFEEIIHDEIRVIRGWAYSTSLRSSFFQEYYDLSLLVPNFDLKFVDHIEEIIVSCLMTSEEKIKRLFDKKKKFELNTKVLADRCGHDILSAVISDLRRYQKINTLADDIKEIQAVKFEDIMEILKYLSRDRCFTIIAKP